MGIIFSKPGCAKCDWLKQNADLTDIDVHELTPDNTTALAELAWHEAVSLTETSLPILVLDDGTKITGALNIRNILSKHH